MFGAGPAGLSVAREELLRGSRVHLVATYLPNGDSLSGSPPPTYRFAAGIQQPFGGKDPNDPRLRMYLGSHPEMMRLARDPDCQAVRECELTTMIDPNQPLPEWASLVDGYRRFNNAEVYTTAAFDPPGLVRYWWEQLLSKFADNLTYECRAANADEHGAIRAQQPPAGFDRMHMCAGYAGFNTILHDGTDFPILGVLVHFEGDGETKCWMDEERPCGTTGRANEPDCLYVIRRPWYHGDGSFEPSGRIVLGGTIKAHVAELPEVELNQVVREIVRRCNERFGESFSYGRRLSVTQCCRPGNTNGFTLRVNADRTYSEIRGQAGMGIVTAYASGVEIVGRMA